MAQEIARRGDGVKDISFNVKNCRAVYERAVSRGAKSLSPPQEYSDEFGTVIMATLATVSIKKMITILCMHQF
jgi:4-hydroxyphenylpyruvate dioxygenase